MSYTFEGDVDEAARWLPFAQNQQRILTKLKMPSRVQTPSDGVTITIRADHIHIQAGSQTAFIYARSNLGTRILQASSNGFAKLETSSAHENVGVIDWQGRLSWNGTHRYSAVAKELNPPTINRDLFIYKGGVVIDLAQTKKTVDGVLVSAGIVGVIAGACMRKKLLVAFVFSDTDTTDAVAFSGVLKAYFITQNNVLSGEPITVATGFTRLLQCVACSKDGTKGSTIATNEEAGYGRRSILVDFEISAETVVTTPILYQDISAAFAWNSSNNSRALTSIVVAVDYKVNTRKEFFIGSSCSRTGANHYTGFINYNDQYTVTIDDIDEISNAADLLTAHRYDFIIINTLDLRHGVFAYTRFVENVAIGGNFVITKQFYLTLGTLVTRFKGDEFLYGTYPDNVQISSGGTTPLYHYAFRTYRKQSEQELFYVPLQYQVFGFWCFQNNQTSEIRADTNYDGTVRDIAGASRVDYPTTLNRVSLPIMDNFGNKLISFSPLHGVISNVFTGAPAVEPETGSLTFTRDAPVIIKIDKNNRYYVAGVKQPDTATDYLILENEAAILELKGVI